METKLDVVPIDYISGRMRNHHLFLLVTLSVVALIYFIISYDKELHVEVETRRKDLADELKPLFEHIECSENIQVHLYESSDVRNIGVGRIEGVEESVYRYDLHRWQERVRIVCRRRSETILIKADVYKVKMFDTHKEENPPSDRGSI